MDHELRAQFSEVFIKPFLVNSDLDEEGEEKVLVMGTDGLWDVTTNERVAAVVSTALDHSFKRQNNEKKLTRTKSQEEQEQVLNKYRYISAAQDLVMASRGKLRTGDNSRIVINGTATSSRRQGWRTCEEKSATIDDISVFVIPLNEFARESKEWIQKRRLKRRCN